MTLLLNRYLNLPAKLLPIKLFCLILFENFAPLCLSNRRFKTMSTSLPSAFDVLMSNASKKKQSQQQKPQQSSPRKRKNPAGISQTSGLNPNASDLGSSVTKPIESAAENGQFSGKSSNLGQTGNALVETLSKDGQQVATGPTVAEDTRASGSSKQEKIKDIEIMSKQSGLGTADSDKDSVVVKTPRLSISPNESLVELKKKAANFNVNRVSYWDVGERVPSMFLVKAFDAISKESSRIAINEIVCNMLRTFIETTPDDLVPVVYFLANRIASAHEGLELGNGETPIIKALEEACGAKEAHELGDLGLVAKASRSSQPLMRKPESLTVAKVFDTFRLLAKESGKDSQDKKKCHIKALLVAATDREPFFDSFTPDKAVYWTGRTNSFDRTWTCFSLFCEALITSCKDCESSGIGCKNCQTSLFCNSSV